MVAKYGKYSPAKFANFVYICITCGKSYHFLAKIAAKIVTFSARNTNIYKICKLRRDIFYNILLPNSAILLTLGSSSGCGKRFRSFSLDRMLVYYAKLC